ncbi:transposase-like protein [Streptomyces sp. SPB162]|nr:transposase-like protein [Streptomyces sp. SPB162]
MCPLPRRATHTATNTAAPGHRGCRTGVQGVRFPPEVIAYAVRLYHRFPLSFRDVDELLFERGIRVSHGTALRV